MEKAALEALFPFPSNTRNHYVVHTLVIAPIPIDPSECSICTDKWAKTSNLGATQHIARRTLDPLVETHCGHKFHQKCLHDWFFCDDNTTTCPECRSKCWPTRDELTAIEHQAVPMLAEAIDRFNDWWTPQITSGGVFNEQLADRYDVILRDEDDPLRFENVAAAMTDVRQEYAKEFRSDWLFGFMQCYAIAKFAKHAGSMMSHRKWVGVVKIRDRIWKEYKRQIAAHFPNNHLCVYYFLQKQLPHMAYKLPLRRYFKLGQLQSFDIYPRYGYDVLEDMEKTYLPSLTLVMHESGYHFEVDSRTTTSDLLVVTVTEPHALREFVVTKEEGLIIIGDQDRRSYELFFQFEGELDEEASYGEWDGWGFHD